MKKEEFLVRHGSRIFFFIWIKDLLSDIIPFMLIIAWSAMAAGYFPDMWGRLTLLGIFVVTIFVFLRIIKS
ncbi:hypothetical protein [Photorhabdus luminescens]|uniref:Uncharacterized protein n=1 Tax=Photorhabdus luminescens subsp. mexicana TaxID=2100167 RepID=A0A4R4J1N1_PHOLU|nr:hypothetical protein [Photorhabdus luminescens]TDB47293.1 hypothetical protein C5468_19670 [Photorhabdus luminescens subsp. mexicana]